ncbi:hypothetical protein EDD22DRAFT_782414, partial [Suillus occidentalis]
NSVILMCHEANVKSCNLYILIFCRHNYDIKYILLGRGAKAIMFYISNYIKKIE